MLSHIFFLSVFTAARLITQLFYVQNRAELVLLAQPIDLWWKLQALQPETSTPLICGRV